MYVAVSGYVRMIANQTGIQTFKICNAATMFLPKEKCVPAYIAGPVLSLTN